MKNIEEIREKLLLLNNFQECIIESIRFLKFATTIEIDFDYIWDDNKNVRKNLKDKKIITLRFELVEKFLLENIFTQGIDNVDFLNWSYNEIAMIKIEDGNDKNRVKIFWEINRKRSIELTFSSLEVIST